MTTHRILVCCGTGIATSVQVAGKIKALLKARGIDVETAECKAIELPTRAAAFRPRAIVSTTQINVGIPGVEVFPGLPFLTGIGMDPVIDSIVTTLNDEV